MRTTDSPAPGNKAGEPAKKKARKKKATAEPVPPVTTEDASPAPLQCGRSAADIRGDTVRYLVKPWFPKRCLTLVAGQPQTGKSSLVAWLMREAEAAAILPGYEESVATSMIPRLQANGVMLRGVLVLDDREYRLPRDKKRILDTLNNWLVNLLVLDPIDSYMEDGKSENTGTDVREFLESCCWIAERADCAVVGVRHPGKEARNIMPGSRAWRAVPRSIVVLGMDASFPPKRFLYHDKDSFGNDATPHRYALDGNPGEPRRFVLKEKMDARLVSFGREVADPTERQEVRKAARYLRDLFGVNPEPFVQDWKSICAANGVSDKDRRIAYRELHLEEKPQGLGGKYIIIRLDKEWPKWTEPEQKTP